MILQVTLINKLLQINYYLQLEIILNYIVLSLENDLIYYYSKSK